MDFALGLASPGRRVEFSFFRGQLPPRRSYRMPGGIPASASELVEVVSIRCSHENHSHCVASLGLRRRHSTARRDGQKARVPSYEVYLLATILRCQFAPVTGSPALLLLLLVKRTSTT